MGKAIIITLRIYISTKAPPPFSLVIHGNFQIFPRPTAEPVAAKININLDDHSPCMDFLSLLIFANSYLNHDTMLLYIMFGYYEYIV